MQEVKLMFQPLTSVISEEREELHVRMKKAFEKADEMLSNPGGRRQNKA